MTAYRCVMCPAWHTTDSGKARQHEAQCGNPLVVRRGPPAADDQPDDSDDQLDLFNQ